MGPYPARKLRGLLRITTDLPDREHPHRLSDEDYSVPQAVVFVSWRARKGITLMGQPAQLLIATMRRMAHKKRLQLQAYCVMPDHVHVVVSLDEGGDVRGWVRYVKRETARVCGTPGMWQRSYWDRHARKSEDVWDMVAYILNNPVRRGLVSEWQEWPYSWSAQHEDA